MEDAETWKSVREPVAWRIRVDGDVAAFTSQQLLPGAGAARAPGHPQRAQSRQHERAIVRRYREMADLGERTQAPVQVVEVPRIVGRAHRSGLQEPVRGAPQAAIGAEIQQAARSEGTVNGMHRRRNLPGVAGARVRGVAPGAAVCERAAEDIFGADKEQRVLLRLRGHRRERQVVVGRRDKTGSVLERGGVPLRSPGRRRACVALIYLKAIRRAHILKQPLIPVVDIHGEGEGVSGKRLHRQYAALDGTSSITFATGRKPGSGLARQPRPRFSVRAGVVTERLHRSQKHPALTIPHHRGRRYPNRRGAVRPVDGAGHEPGLPCVGRVVEARGWTIFHIGTCDLAFARLPDRGDHQVRRRATPGKTRETRADERILLVGVAALGDLRPSTAAIRGTQDAYAVIGVERIIRVARACQDRLIVVRIEAQGTD